MFVIQHPLVKQHYATCYPVAIAIAQALAREHPSMLGAHPNWRPLSLEHLRPLRVVGLSEVYEIAPAPLFGAASPLRHRYSLDLAGREPTTDMVPVRFTCGTVAIELLAHQHLSALVVVNRAIESAYTETVCLNLSDGDSNVSCPVDVGYVRIEDVLNVLCLTIQQAKALRNDMHILRPYMCKAERAYLSKLPSVPKTAN